MSTNDPRGNDPHRQAPSQGGSQGPHDPQPQSAPGWQAAPGSAPRPDGAGPGAYGSGGPSAQSQAWGQQAAPAPSPADRGFFTSIRYSGWFRSDTRVVGGVCSGIAAKTGWDVGLVRGLTVVLGLFFGFVWIAYGVAWALLPEQRDGRIHLEQLIHGRGDVAQLGAATAIVAGFAHPFNWSFDHGWGVIPVLVGVAIVAVVVIVATQGTRTRPGASVPPGGQAPSQPGFQAAPTQHPTWTAPPATGQGAPAAQSQQASWNAAPQPPASAAHGSAPTWQEPPRAPMAAAPPTWSAQGTSGSTAGGTAQYRASTAAPHAPVQAPPTWTAPTPAPQTPHVSKAVTLSIVGVLFLILAGTVYFTDFFQGNGPYQASAIAVGGAACLVLVGAALAISALRGKRAVTLIVLSVIGAMLWPFALAAGAAHEQFTSMTVVESSSGSAGPLTQTWQSGGIRSHTGPASMDLRGAPTDEDLTIPVTEVAGPLTILVEPGQPVMIQLSEFAGTVDSRNAAGEPLAWIPPRSLGVVDNIEFTSPTWDGTGVTLDVFSCAGTVTVIEEPLDDANASQSAEAQSGASADNAPTHQSGAAPTGEEN